MELTSIPWNTIALTALATVGIVQWLKGALKNVPTWVWAIAAAVLCAGLAAATYYISAWILYGAVALSFTQLGYEIIVQGIPEIIKRLMAGFPSSTPKATPPAQ